MAKSDESENIFLNGIEIKSQIENGSPYLEKNRRKKKCRNCYPNTHTIVVIQCPSHMYIDGECLSGLQVMYVRRMNALNFTISKMDEERKKRRLNQLIGKTGPSRFKKYHNTKERKKKNEIYNNLL